MNDINQIITRHHRIKKCRKKILLQSLATASGNRGKSGGYRIYLYVVEINKILTPITIYSKNEKESLSFAEMGRHLEIVKTELSTLPQSKMTCGHINTIPKQKTKMSAGILKHFGVFPVLHGETFASRERKMRLDIESRNEPIDV